MRVFPLHRIEKNMSKRKFWPLDFDLEGEIYENPAWDLPGFRRTHATRPVRRARVSEDAALNRAA
jgi:hypothetical protein